MAALNPRMTVGDSVDGTGARRAWAMPDLKKAERRCPRGIGCISRGRACRLNMIGPLSASSFRAGRRSASASPAALITAAQAHRLRRSRWRRSTSRSSAHHPQPAGRAAAGRVRPDADVFITHDLSVVSACVRPHRGARISASIDGARRPADETSSTTRCHPYTRALLTAEPIGPMPAALRHGSAGSNALKGEIPSSAQSAFRVPPSARAAASPSRNVPRRGHRSKASMVDGWWPVSAGAKFRASG
jgi:hypothetical protein